MLLGVKVMDPMPAQVRHYLRVLLREEAVYQPLKLR